MVISAGSRLGPYELLSPLGAGGMGEVYRARDARLGREVAIKVLPAEVASDASRLKRFEKEARSASALNHPNIVTIYEIGTSDSVSYIAMERVDGKTLRELLFGGAIPIKRLLPIAAQIADGLARAHEAGIVHRDLKPENVMVTRDGLVKILDFGLAKQTAVGSGSDEGSHMPTETGTSPGLVLGTVGYMSPEQAAGQPVDFRSDQFAFGSILYEMATGKRAFQKGTAVDTLSAILHEEPKPVGEVNREAPAPFRWIVERCLAKEAEGRYASTKDLARELATVRDHLSDATISGAVRATAIPPFRRGLAAAALALTLAVIGFGSLLTGKRLGRTPLPRFQQLTFRHGHAGAARFSPDGRTVVYSAAWDDGPYELYTTQPGSLESRPLGIRGSILSLSSAGEMALFLMPGQTLARAPLAGGAPRELLKNVRWADWSPDGKSLAIIRRVQGKFRLEYPIGQVIYESAANWLDNLHVSPEGDRVALREVGGQGIHNTGSDVIILNATTKEKKSTGIESSEFGWGPGGRELWLLQNEGELRAMISSGRERVVARFPGFFQLDDIGKDGRLLLERIDIRWQVSAFAAGAQSERTLSWLDSSWAAGVSDDGTTVLIGEQSHNAIYLRKTDGSPAIPLGEGKALALSPDGGQVLALRAGPPPQLVVLPAGAGETKVLNTRGFESFVGGSILPDGKRVLFGGTEPGHRPRLYVVDIEGGKARPVSPEGVELGEMAVRWVSPDGKLVFARDPTRRWSVYPLDGVPPSSPLPIAGLHEGDGPVGWTADSRSLFIQDERETPASVFRINWTTGERELFREFRPLDPTGISASVVLVTPDGRTSVYSYLCGLSQLYLVEGLE